MIGRTLSHYELLSKLGSGGMGDVYVARDTELDRKIALKVLPEELSESEGRRARFRREAKALAALNHPNIVTVYSVEESEGVHFITMELVNGQTLTDHLPRSGISLNAFFEVAVPLADAVAAAHEQGIVHRDLKPGNIMVSNEGRVKVLDFGLAKPTSALRGMEAASDLPTATQTKAGVIVGTVSYMSPEQAQGKNVWRVPILEDREATWQDAQQLTFEQANVRSIDLSPDGTTLVLDSDRGGNADIWALPLADGEMTQLTTHKTPDYTPTWSPDGRQVAFYSYRSGNRDIWVVPADGGPARQLTRDPATDMFPFWSPDGSEITFYSDRDGHH